MVKEQRVQQLRQIEKPRYARGYTELLAVILAVNSEDLITDNHALRWLRSLDTENEIGRSKGEVDLHYLQ